MRILLLSQQFDVRGGSDVMVHVSKRLLEEAGHDVFLFAATPDAVEAYPSDTHFERPSAGRLHRYFYHSEAASKLDRFLEQHPVDVAHAHIYYGKLTPAILGPLRRRGIPLLQHLHEYRSFCSISVAVRDGKNCEACSVGNYWAGLRYRCNRGSLVRSLMSTMEMYSGDALGVKSYPRRFLTVSHFQKRLLVQQGMDEARMDVLYNPVDSSFFDVERIGGSGVLYAGRLEDYKGVFDLVEVAASMPETQFLALGDGEARPAIEKMIAERGIVNLKLAGSCSRRDLINYMRHADALLLPSIAHETFGLAAGEAMAASLPVVSSDAGALPEVVAHDIAGMVVPRGDVNGYVRALSDLFAEPRKGEVMGAAGRLRVKELFSERVYQEKLSSELSNLVPGSV